MRHETVFIGIMLIMSNVAIGAESTGVGTNQGEKKYIKNISKNRAENPFEYCGRIGTDDNPGDVPAPLTPAFALVFGVRMAPSEIQQNSSFRCYRGKVMGCMVGANLNCGKADTSKTSKGGDEWCRSHPNDSMIPMAATGHATIYTWRCSGNRAIPEKGVTKVDDRGFEVMNWKPLN